MLSFPNAKINLGLNIVSKRPDGYHNIESCFYPIPWYDVLEILPSTELKYESSGLAIPGDPRTNLCFKAYNLLREQFAIDPVYIHLHKVIPLGAGLGGGSADGAFTLKMLNQLFELKLSADELKALAAQLGSDCPFFIDNKPVLAVGTGTTFKELSVNLSGKYIALKHPGIHIGTAEAYSQVKPTLPENSITSCLSKPVTEWKNCLKNDFETSIFPQHPTIESIKKELYKNGAVYASMSGSGSAVYGLFESEPDLPNFEVFRL